GFASARWRSPPLRRPRTINLQKAFYAPIPQARFPLIDLTYDLIQHTLHLARTNAIHASEPNDNRSLWIGLYATASLPGCVARVPADAIPAGGKLSVPLVVTPEAPGLSRGVLHLTTDVKDQPKLAARLQVLVKSPDEAKPR
ncbi:MAG: hypothetical protein JXL80_11340, partial [Planctomycetes bacterium]|nr:hypothetical protein [Planctomycetota bacterium]